MDQSDICMRGWRIGKVLAKGLPKVTTILGPEARPLCPGDCFEVAGVLVTLDQRPQPTSQGYDIHVRPKTPDDTRELGYIQVTLAGIIPYFVPPWFQLADD